MPRVTYLFRDDEGRVGEAAFWLPAPSSFAVYDVTIIELGRRIAALSNALLIGAELRLVYPFSSGPVVLPAKGANRLLLFYREGAIGYALNVPAARSSLPYDTTGTYAGVRLSRDSLAATGLLADIELLPQSLVFRSGDPVPTTFVVGGRTRSGV